MSKLIENRKCNPQMPHLPAPSSTTNEICQPYYIIPICYAIKGVRYFSAQSALEALWEVPKSFDLVYFLGYY